MYNFHKNMINFENKKSEDHIFKNVNSFLKYLDEIYLEKILLSNFDYAWKEVDVVLNFGEKITTETLVKGMLMALNDRIK